MAESVKSAYNKKGKYNKLLEYLLIIFMFLTPITRSGLNIFAFFILIVWIIKKVRCPDTRGYNLKYIKWLLGYGCIILLSTFNAVDKWGVIDKFVGEYLKYVVIFLVVLEVIRKEEQMKRLWLTFFLASLVVYGYAFYQYFTYNFRIYSTLHNPNPFGTYLTMTVFFSFCFAFTEKNKVYKYITYFYSLIGLVLLTLSYSRGAWLGFIAGLMVIIFYSLYLKENFNFKKLVVLILIIGVLGIVFLPGRAMERFQSITDFQGNSIKYRFMQYKTSLKMIKDKPLFGIGLDQYRSVFPDYKPEGISRVHIHVHNLYLHWAVETGLVGLLGLIIVIVKIIPFNYIFKINPEYKWYYMAMLGSGMSFFVHNFFDVTFLYSMVGINLVVMTAIFINIINQQKNGFESERGERNGN